MPDEKIIGSCFCGAVKLEVKGETNGFVQCFSVFAISSEQPTANVGQKVGLSFKLEGLHVFDDKDQRIKYM